MTISKHTESQEDLNSPQTPTEDSLFEADDFIRFFEEVEVCIEEHKPIYVVKPPTPQTSFLEKAKSFYNRYRVDLQGVGLGFLSGFIFTGNSYVIQTWQLDFSECLLVRSLIFLYVMTVLCCLQNHKIWPDQKRVLVIVQGLLGGLTLISAFSCVLLLPLGDALTLMFSSPISTMILAALFLGHRLRLLKIICGIVLMIGTLLVIQPEFLFTSPENHDEVYYIGASIALASAVADGFLNVSISCCEEINSLVLLWWTGFGGIIVSLLAFTFDPNAKMFSGLIVEIAWQSWLAYVLLSFSGLAAYFCMTKSLQMADPTIIAFIRSFEIVIAYIVQYAVQGNIPNSLSVIGATLVFLSVTSMALQKLVVGMMPERIKFLC